MGIVVQFPIGGARESLRTIRVLEKFVRDHLADGPQPFEKVYLAAKYISEDENLVDEAMFNLNIGFIKDQVNDRVYLALPGDEYRVPNAGQRSHLERCEG
jgi:hypothetical protein